MEEVIPYTVKRQYSGGAEGTPRQTQQDGEGDGGGTGTGTR